MKSSGIVVYAAVILLSFGCSGSQSNSAGSATATDSCDMNSARQAYLDGYKDALPGDYTTAGKMYTQAAEGYQNCVQSLDSTDRLQAQYDEAIALEGESFMLGKAQDYSKSIDVAQNAELLFEAVATDPASNVINRFYDKPGKSTLRTDAQFQVSSLRTILVTEAKIEALSTPTPQIESTPSSSDDSGGLQTFTTEDDAQAHCPDDTVVWLNLSSGIYHMKGERWYGATENGAYVCQQEADAAGDRQTENGQ